MTDRTPREDAIAALRAAARAVVDAQPMDWSVPSLHPDHIEVHENAFDALMDSIDALDLALAALGAEAETPDPDVPAHVMTEEYAEFKRGEVRAAGALMLGGGHWVDLASPETAEALARALFITYRATFGAPDDEVWLEKAAAILAAMRETGR